MGMESEEDDLELAEFIIDYRTDGLSREAIAEALEISFSDVKRIIKKFSIKKTPKGGFPPIESSLAISLPPNDGVPLMEQAQEILGLRLTSDWRGYKLDGRPSNTDAIVEAAGLKFYDET
jgi:hypothetical protein